MRDMNQRPVCHRAEDLVTYLYGEASEADALDFRRHLRQCDSCRGEFTVFNQVHDSIKVWRNEALGASFSPAAISPKAIDQAEFIHDERKRSAPAALRGFVAVSPLWLRGATAFAALLLCVLGVMTLARLSRPPVTIAQTGKDEKMYTQQQLDSAVNQAVEKKAAELSNQAAVSSSIAVDKEKFGTGKNRVQVAASQPQKNVHPQRLTPRERDQLAADLRLTPIADEDEMLLAFPEQEHPNQ
ncbi:MAG: zf-HC2 domain-containing protein [Pyrinomonadaceae bacterium]